MIMMIYRLEDPKKVKAMRKNVARACRLHIITVIRSNKVRNLQMYKMSDKEINSIVKNGEWN